VSEETTSLGSTTPTFGVYGKNFQESVVHALLIDNAFAEQMSEVIKFEYFDQKYLQFIVERIFKYHLKYKAFPTMSLLASIVRDELKIGSDKLLAEQIVDYLIRVRANKNLGDLGFVREKSLDFCRKCALKEAMEKSIDLMESEKYDAIVDVMKKAVTVGTTPSLGHDFFEDSEARFRPEIRNAIPTGIAELDHREILNGGLGKGELGIIVGGAGCGKSHFLVERGCAALVRGINVVHYTLELSETLTGKRYDANLCGLDFNDIPENKELILDTYKKQQENWGRLIIKHYPTNTPTVQTLRAHLERCAVKGFIPGLVIVDYADIMRSSRQFDSLRHELKLVYEELRGFADEMGVPCWSGSQSNKEGVNSEVIDLTNMSEAFGKAMVADVVMTLSRKSQEKALGIGRLYVAKNRAGKDGILWPVKIDTAQSRITISGGQASFEEETKSNESEMKKQIRAKLEQLENDKTIRDKLKNKH
jgi:replicative DNA helicase